MSYQRAVGGGFPLFVVLAAALLAGGCARSDDATLPPPPVDGGDGGPSIVACTAEHFCAGAAKRSITPTQEEIDGIEEPRLGGLANRVQKFNLGGFGLNPTQNLPSPFAAVGEALTHPADERAYINRKQQEEDTWLRVLVLEAPNEGGEMQRMAFVVIDAIGAGNLIQERMTAAVNEVSCGMDACVAPEHVLFGQTHSHAGADLQGLWGGVPQDWVENRLIAAGREAIAEALSNRAAADVSIAQGFTVDFNNYRRPRIDPNDDADGILSLLRVTHLDSDDVIASLMQYAAHPTSIDEDPRVPHPDYILGAVETLERDGGVGLYYNGPIADASGSGGDCSAIAEPDAYDRVRCRGTDLANFARRQLDAPVKLAPTLAIRSVEVTLPVTNPAFAAVGVLGSFSRYYNFYPTEVRQIPGLGGILDTTATEIGQVTPAAVTYVSRVTLGGAQGLEIATIPGEATNTFGKYIRSLADPAAKVMLLGLTQNSFGYIIPEEEFSYIDPTGETGFLIPFTGYEEFVSLGPLTAPLLRAQAYAPLFDKPLQVPEYLAACAQPLSEHCLINDIAMHVDYIQKAYAQKCLDAGAPEAFCGLINPDTPLVGPCLEAGLPSGICTIFGPLPPAEPPALWRR